MDNIFVLYLFLLDHCPAQGNWASTKIGRPAGFLEILIFLKILWDISQKCLEILIFLKILWEFLKFPEIPELAMVSYGTHSGTYAALARPCWSGILVWLNNDLHTHSLIHILQVCGLVYHTSG